LQTTVLGQQSTAYQSRQAMLSQQKRLEGDLTQIAEHRAKLEQQYSELKGRYDREQQSHLQEVTRLRDSIARTEQERVVQQKQFAQERAEWDRQIQSLLLQNTQLEDQLQALRRDKTLVDTRLEQQQEAWEGERLELQIQINTLEDGLTLYKARANQNLPPDTAQLVEQLRTEAATELNQRRAAWEGERKTLQGQLEQLRAELRAPPASSKQQPSPQTESWEREKQNLLQQLDQAHQLRRNLEEKMAARDRQSEQERGALEAEIEQLMDRFLRMHNERNG
jgi:chromosome segregation ATPase